MSESCSNCGREVLDYSTPHCPRCGFLLGWPNYRKAISEQAALEGRYRAARKSLEDRGLTALLDELERLADAGLPVIGMDCHACKDLLLGGKYQNYFRRVEIGARDLAPEVNHGDRSMVNDRIYPQYGRYLQYGLLSPDGDGLTSYGPLAVSWGVHRDYLSTRATLLEENEFLFYEANKLGALRTAVPAGFRATWQDRSKLAVAKLSSQIGAATNSADLPGLMLRQGADRWSDVFVEVVIYAEGGVDSDDVVEVRLQEPLRDRPSQRAWREVQEICNRRGIKVGSVR